MTWGTNIATSERNAAQNVSPGPGEWDQVDLAGEVCPGTAQVRVKAPSNLDVQKPKGGKRATVKDDGDPLMTVDISLELQPDELQEFVQFILPILKPPGKNQGRDPVTIRHPMCAAFNIAAVIVDTIDMDHPRPGGTMTVGISCYEWSAGPQANKVKNKVQSGDASTAAKTQQLIETNPTDPDILDNLTK